MNKQYFATIGSGCVPHIGYGPAHHFLPGSFPGANSKNDLRTRVGDGIILLNPEDFSVSIGLRPTAVTVTTSPTPLPANPLEYRRALVVHNNGTSTIYLGDSSVTISNGLPLIAGEKIAFDIQNNPNVVVYAIASTSVNVRVLELA
jgi:hypothetical protein